MSWHFNTGSLGRTLVTACAFACLAPAALAADASYCITCKNPDQTYRCRVTSEAPTAADALKLYCIIRTAQDGKHSSCSADRKPNGCGGEEKVYAFDGAALSSQVASDPRVRNVIEEVQRRQQPFAEPKGNAPKTMFELGGRAVSASRQGWQNARSRISGSSADTEPAPVPRAAPSPAPQAAPLPQSEPATTQATVQSAPQAAAANSAPESESRMKRASAAVGGFARKSYRCMRSFFRSCSDEAVQ